jgi:hypothetical protein
VLPKRRSALFSKACASKPRSPSYAGARTSPTACIILGRRGSSKLANAGSPATPPGRPRPMRSSRLGRQAAPYRWHRLVDRLHHRPPDACHGAEVQQGSRAAPAGERGNGEASSERFGNLMCQNRTRFDTFGSKKPARKGHFSYCHTTRSGSRCPTLEKPLFVSAREQRKHDRGPSRPLHNASFGQERITSLPAL